MNHYVVFSNYDAKERYWTGGQTDIGEPKVSTNLQLAAKYDSAREAYEAAAAVGKHSALQRFHVGRRPNPVHLS